MQEKSTKPFQQKLDALTELPEGFSFDAEQSWNKMEEQLTGRTSKKRKRIWYMAAASVVLLFSTIYFTQQKSIEPLTVKPQHNNKQSVIAQTKNNEAVLNKQQKEPIHAPQIAKTKSLPQQKPVEITDMPEVTKQPELIVQSNPAQETKTETSLPETPIAVAQLSITPAKRKIVHINELGKEAFLKEQQSLSVKEEKASPEAASEETQPVVKPWYKKFKSSHRTNNN